MGVQRNRRRAGIVLYMLAVRGPNKSSLDALQRRSTPFEGVGGETGLNFFSLSSVTGQYRVHVSKQRTIITTSPCQRFTIQPMIKLAKLPNTSPPVRQNPARDPAMSFSSSSMAGFKDGEEAMIMLREEIQLARHDAD
jgi:hypothetical protein